MFMRITYFLFCVAAQRIITNIISIIIDLAVNQSLDMIATIIFNFMFFCFYSYTIYDVIFHDDDDEHDEHSSLSFVAWLCD